MYQLARALYEVHSAHESQPAIAIQETLQRTSDNTDRRAILLAARISAEALARRRLIIIKSGKAQPQQQLIVFEQLRLLKQAKLARQPPCPFWTSLENSQKDWGDAKVGRRRKSRSPPRHDTSVRRDRSRWTDSGDEFRLPKVAPSPSFTVQRTHAYTHTHTNTQR